ncbi:MAG: hypothetical protein N2260_02970 [Syntrophobacterales bacterium]|nr:hypothetical protein [Syntrophobacterales bacterium]
MKVIEILKEVLRQTLKENLLISLFLVASVIIFVRPIVVMKDGVTEKILWGWIWSKVHVTFVNSVTEKIVEINCFPLWKFSGFKAKTDPETELYYTNGSYSWNELLKREKTSTIDYCSMKGVTICLENHCFHTNGGCVSLRLLWH